MWETKRDIKLELRLKIKEVDYQYSMRKIYQDVARDIAVDRDKLKVELVSASQKCAAGCAEILRLAQQIESCRRVAAEGFLSRDKEIAFLKYKLANPSSITWAKCNE